MAGRNETRVAVFLGGRSPEHDVSVVTGLQALKAIDQQRFLAFPVYVSPRGQWFVGDALAERRNYLPDARTESELTEVALSLGEPGRGLLAPKRGGLFGRRAARARPSGPANAVKRVPTAASRSPRMPPVSGAGSSPITLTTAYATRFLLLGHRR